MGVAGFFRGNYPVKKTDSRRSGDPVDVIHALEQRRKSRIISTVPSLGFARTAMSSSDVLAGSTYLFFFKKSVNERMSKTSPGFGRDSKRFFACKPSPKISTLPTRY